VVLVEGGERPRGKEKGLYIQNCPPLYLFFVARGIDRRVCCKILMLKRGREG